MDKDNNELENMEFLVIKSRDLLQEQLKSYEGVNNKSGLLLSISSLIIPILVGFLSNSSILVRCFAILPIILIGIALFYLLKIIKPKGLDHGFNFEQFDSQISKSKRDLLLYEIGANKSSFNDNKPILDLKNRNFEKGIKFIFWGTVALLSLVFYSLLYREKENINKFENSKSEINKIKIQVMGDQNSNNEANSNSNNQGNQTQQTQQESSPIPYVPQGERANIQKGADPKPVEKK